MYEFKTKKSLLNYFLKGSKKFFLASILFASLSSVFDLLNPKIIQFTVDVVIGHSNKPLTGFLGKVVSHMGGNQVFYSRLPWMAGLVLLVALLAAICRYAFTLFNAKGAETFVQHMRDSLYEHILYLPYGWHANHHTGDIIQRCTSDVETIKVFVSQQLTQLFRVVLMIVLSLTFMIRIHLVYALITALFIPVVIVGSVVFHHKIGNTFELVDQEEGRLSSIAQENLTGIRVVRAFGKEAYEKKRFEKQNHGYTNLWVRLQKTLATFWVYGNVMSHLRNILVTLLGIYYCVQGSLTAGGFIAFFSYTTMLSLPVRGLGRIIAEMSKAGISLERLREIMAAETESQEGIEPESIQGDIVFENVSFRYDGSDQHVLDGLSAHIPAGKTIGILGSTGSGKSTMMVLLDRLYDLGQGQGRILLDGIDIQKISRKWLRQHIGMVLQEPFLFSKTLEENISIARPSVSKEELDHVARVASLDSTIEHFEDGYSTFVGQRGISLSGGQKQRTAIAQMLVRKPKIMIFDDSLSAVDTETDTKIRKALQEDMGDATVLLIAHRITTLMAADWILVMEKGKVIQQGTHEDLIEQEGMYQKTYRLQTQGAGDLV